MSQALRGEGDESGNSCTIGSEIYLDVSYLHYLYDARLCISGCLRACRVWSARYDGEDPPPEKYQPTGVLEEPGLRSQQSQAAARRRPRALATHPHPRQPPRTEPPSALQLELEWDDSYDACPVQTDGQEESQPAPLPQPPAEPPKHIQEMRKTAIMLVKGLYVEENDFQDDVMVYDLVAKKDSRDASQGQAKLSRAEAGKTESPKNGLNLPASHSCRESKVKGQAECKVSSPQSNTAAGIGEDLLAQYEELIRTLDSQSGAKSARGGSGESKKAIASRPEAEAEIEVEEEEEEAEEDEMDFTSFSAETPESEKVHSPFGKFFSGNAGKGHSVPFTGEFQLDSKREEQHKSGGCRVVKTPAFLPAGPFVSVLLSRMENMLSNPLHVNLLLTGILAQLAAYPQPLLRSFLLNTNLVFQPTVRSLYQVTKTRLLWSLCGLSAALSLRHVYSQERGTSLFFSSSSLTLQCRSNFQSEILASCFEKLHFNNFFCG